MKKRKLCFGVIAVSLLGALLLVSCKKEKNGITVKSEIISDKTEVECSKDLAKKELQIEEGTYSFEVQNISTFGGTLKVQIEDIEGSSVIETSDNVLEDFSLEVDESSKTIVLKADSKKTYRNLNCTVIVHAAVVSVLAGETADISYLAPETESVSITAKQAAKIEAAGSCTKVDYVVSDAAQVSASELRAKQTEVKASGSAKVAVYAGSKIKIDASGASTVIYEGNPESVEQQTAGAASIEGKG